MIEQEPLSMMFNNTKMPNIWSGLSASFGDQFFDLDGNSIRRGDQLNNIGRLPLILDNSRMLTGDEIPRTSYGSNLANLLTPKSWNSLRGPLIDDHHSVCEICGQKCKTLDVHEVWRYFFPERYPLDIDENIEMYDNDNEMFIEGTNLRRFDPDKLGIQVLEGLVAICQACHACFHRTGEERTDQRLAGINQWSMQQMKRYNEILMLRWGVSYGLHWVLDLGMIPHPDGVFTVRTSWTIYENDNRFITKRRPYGRDAITALIGCDWQYHNEKTKRSLSYFDLQLSGGTLT